MNVSFKEKVMDKDTKKYGFFEKMKRSDRPGFEIAMFSISVAVALAVLVGIFMVGWYYYKGQAAHFTDEEVNAGSVTQAAVEVDKEEEEPVQTIDPNSDMIINEDNIFEGDEELKDAEFAYTTSAVNLREEASLTSNVLYKIPFGEKVTMISYDGKEWAHVSYNNIEGYISAMYLSVDKPVPVVTMTPVQTTKPTKTPKPTKKPKQTVAPDETAEPDYPEETEAPAPATPEPTEAPAPTEEPPAPTEEPPAPTEAPPAEPTPEQ